MRPIARDLLEKIQDVIQEKTAFAKNKEDEERMAGKVLEDNPVARLVFEPANVVYWTIGLQDSRREEYVVIWNSEYAVFYTYLLRRSTTTYCAARRTWAAYTPVSNLLKETGFSQEEIHYYMPQLFPFVYGVFTIVRYRSPRGNQVLLGVRSKKIAGKNPGTVSFPGGLVKPNERLIEAVRREFAEEGGNGKLVFKPVLAWYHFPDCPSITFGFLAETDSQLIGQCEEWHGRRVIWAPEEHLLRAVNGDNGPLVQAFRENNIEVDDNLAFAPDAQKTAKELLEEVYPEKC